MNDNLQTMQQGEKHYQAMITSANERAMYERFVSDTDVYLEGNQSWSISPGQPQGRRDGGPAGDPALFHAMQKQLQR